MEREYIYKSEYSKKYHTNKCPRCKKTRLNIGGICPRCGYNNYASGGIPK